MQTQVQIMSCITLKIALIEAKNHQNHYKSLLYGQILSKIDLSQIFRYFCRLPITLLQWGFFVSSLTAHLSFYSFHSFVSFFCCPTLFIYFAPFLSPPSLYSSLPPFQGWVTGVRKRSCGLTLPFPLMAS